MARVGRGAAVLAGCVVMAYGGWGLLASHAVPHTANLLVWLAASVLGHDAVIAPVVFALCWAGARLLPPWAKPWAAGALLAGGCAFLVGLAALLGKGRDSNPTVLPLDYGRNILVVLLAVAVTAAAAAGGSTAVRAARRAAGKAAGTSTGRTAGTSAVRAAGTSAVRTAGGAAGTGARRTAGSRRPPQAAAPHHTPDHEHQKDHENHEQHKDQEHQHGPLPPEGPQHRADDAGSTALRQQGGHADEPQP
jgi:hypothetical protein